MYRYMNIYIIYNRDYSMKEVECDSFASDLNDAVKNLLLQCSATFVEKYEKYYVFKHTYNNIKCVICKYFDCPLYRVLPVF